MPTSERTAPRSAYVSLVLAVIGLGISIYLTYEHYTGNKSLSCPNTGKVNCAKVTTSQWSHIGGVPVAVFGLIFFVGMTVLCLPWLWRFPQLDALRVLGVVAGIGSVLYLVWIELFKVDAICLWCTGVHVITLLLLGAVLWTNSEVRAA
jgi:uncharacterized membrane protein